MKSAWGLAGCVAVLWVLVFGGGVVIDSCEYRHALAPHVVSCKLPDSATAKTAKAAAAGSDGTSLVPHTMEVASVDGPTLQPQQEWTDFFKAVLFYTPLNLALLSPRTDHV